MSESHTCQKASPFQNLWTERSTLHSLGYIPHGHGTFPISAKMYLRWIQVLITGIVWQFHSTETFFHVLNLRWVSPDCTSPLGNVTPPKIRFQACGLPGLVFLGSTRALSCGLNSYASLASPWRKLGVGCTLHLYLLVTPFGALFLEPSDATACGFDLSTLFWKQKGSGV